MVGETGIHRENIGLTPSRWQLSCIPLPGFKSVGEERSQAVIGYALHHSATRADPLCIEIPLTSSVGMCDTYGNTLLSSI